jgi:hypothetical protein
MLYRRLIWPIEVAFVIHTGTEREWKALVPILLYLIFVALGVFVASELGYLLSALEKGRPISRRCRRPHEVHRRRSIRRQRARCRLEG